MVRGHPPGAVLRGNLLFRELIWQGTITSRDPRFSVPQPGRRDSPETAERPKAHAGLYRRNATPLSVSRAELIS